MAARPEKKARPGAARAMATAKEAETAFLAAALGDPETLRRRLVLAIALAPPKARTRGRRRP